MQLELSTQISVALVIILLTGYLIAVLWFFLGKTCVRWKKNKDPYWMEEKK